jgi:hypothetical protein
MSTEQTLPGDYFDTPARAERLQLLLHLVRNAGEVIYLRGPAGTGKTRFVHRLFDILGDETATVWVHASSDSDVSAVVVDELGLAPEDGSPWPDAVLNGINGRDLLVVVDDADRLGLEAVESLAQLHARGGRLLLVGQGGLAQTNGNWDVQFVDLPPFDAEQTVAFLRSQAGDQAARVTDDLAAGLHRAANGVPGLLLDALNGVLASRRSAPRAPQSAVRPEMSKRPIWHWVVIGLALVVLVAVLQFQDQINAVFLPEDGVGQSAPEQVEAEPVSPAGRVEPASEPVPPENLRDEAVSALMPEIALPELSREPTASGPISVDRAEGLPQEVPAEATAEPSVAPDSSGDDDLLDAVMRDALAAAEKQQVSEPALAEPPAATDQRVVDKASTDATQVASVDKPADGAATATVPEAAMQESGSVPEKPTVLVPQAREPAAEVRQPQVVNAVPAPVETRRAPSAGAPVVEPKPARVVSHPAPVVGSDWLKTRKPAHYTLQLVGARDRRAVEKFVRDYGIDKPFAIFERDLKGKPWYSLVAGDYPNRDAAIAARGLLPKRLERSGVWPRTFDSIQKSVK